MQEVQIQIGIESRVLRLLQQITAEVLAPSQPADQQLDRIRSMLVDNNTVDPVKYNTYFSKYLETHVFIIELSGAFAAAGLKTARAAIFTPGLS